jgi:hypothetical protein
MAFGRTRRITPQSGTFFGTGAFVSASFTPADNTKLVVRIGAQSIAGDTLQGSDLTISGGSLTWTSQVASTTHPGWGYGDRVYTAPVTTGASMTLTIDAGAFDIHDYLVEVDEFTEAAAVFVGATASGSDADGDGAASITLSAAPAATSICLSYAQSASNGGTANTVTPGTSWSEISEIGVNDYTTYQSQERTGSTSTSVDWNDLTATGNPLGATLTAIEIIAAAVGGDIFFGQACL